MSQQHTYHNNTHITTTHVTTTHITTHTSQLHVATTHTSQQPRHNYTSQLHTSQQHTSQQHTHHNISQQHTYHNTSSLLDIGRVDVKPEVDRLRSLVAPQCIKVRVEQFEWILISSLGYVGGKLNTLYVDMHTHTIYQCTPIPHNIHHWHLLMLFHHYKSSCNITNKQRAQFRNRNGTLFCSLMNIVLLCLFLRSWHPKATGLISSCSSVWEKHSLATSMCVCGGGDCSFLWPFPQGTWRTGQDGLLSRMASAP